MFAMPVSRAPRLTGEARIAALTILEGKIDWRRKFFLPQGKSPVVFSFTLGCSQYPKQWHNYRKESVNPYTSK